MTVTNMRISDSEDKLADESTEQVISKLEEVIQRKRPSYQVRSWEFFLHCTKIRDKYFEYKVMRIPCETLEQLCINIDQANSKVMGAGYRPDEYIE